MTPEQNQRIKQIRERRVGIAQFGPLSVGSTPGSHRSFVTVEGRVGLEANCGVASERNNAKAEFFANAPTDIDFLLSLVKEQEVQTTGLNLLRQLVGGKNSLRTLGVFPCNQAEHENVDCECFWEQCEAWAKADAETATPPQ